LLTANSQSPRLGADVTISGTITTPSTSSNALSINGKTLVLSGAFISGGMLKGNATSGLVINGSVGTIKFSQGGTNNANSLLKTLNVMSAGNVTLGNKVRIVGGADYGIVSLYGNGVLNSNGNLILLSDNDGVAQIGVSSSNAVINGDVQYDQYFRARRAWRFFGTPFVSSSHSLHEAWQENLTDVVAGACPPDQPGTPGSGVSISYNSDASNGYDWNNTGNASLYVWNGATDEWETPTSTIGTLLSDYPAYCIFVRGDRNVCLTYQAPPNETTLHSTGVLYPFGDITQTTSVPAGNWVFTANPKPATIDLAGVLGRSSGIASNQFAFWDPTIDGSYNIGGYVQYLNGVMVPNSGLYPNPTTYAQMGQGVFFLATAATQSLVFKETDKVNSQSYVYGLTKGKLHAQKQTALMNGLGVTTNPTMYIGVKVLSYDTLMTAQVAETFDNSYSDAVDYNDASKLWKIEGNDMALVRGTATLSIEGRKFPTSPTQVDTMFVRMYLLHNKDFILHINFANVPLSGGALPSLLLVDLWQKTTTPISIATGLDYSFSTTDDTGSIRNRFLILLCKTGFNQGNFTAQTFAALTSAFPQGSARPAEITSPEESVSSLRSSGVDTSQSVIAASAISKMKKLSLYPNPAKGMLFISNLSVGDKIIVSDLSGRVLSTKRVVSATESVVTATLSPGMYILTISNSKGRETLKFMKE
jgi:hypothetical protein